MRFGIKYKLALAFAALSLLVTLIAFLAISLSFRAGFLQYVNDMHMASLQRLRDVVAERIVTRRDWRQLVNDHRFWDELLKQAMRDNPGLLLDGPADRRDDDGRPPPRRNDEGRPAPRRDDEDRRPPPARVPIFIIATAGTSHLTTCHCPLLPSTMPWSVISA